MRVLITGSTGFVGRTVTRRLYSEGHELCILVRSKRKADSLFPDTSISIIQIGNTKEWMNSVKEFAPEIVIHLAAYFTGSHDSEAIDNLINSNIVLTTLLLESIKDCGCKAFVNTGTFTEYLHGTGVFCPNNLYSAIKSAERPIIGFYNSLSGWKWVNVVLYSPYGRKNEVKKVIDHLLDALDSIEPKPFSLGNQILDFIHVDDIADFYVNLINNIDRIPKTQEFHLGTGSGHSIREMAEAIETVFNGKVNALWGALPYRENDPMHAVAPIAETIGLLDWRAKISPLEGIAILKDDLYYRE